MALKGNVAQSENALIDEARKVAAQQETTRLTFDLPKWLHKTFKTRVAEEDTTMNEILNKKIKEYVSEGS